MFHHCRLSDERSIQHSLDASFLYPPHLDAPIARAGTLGSRLALTVEEERSAMLVIVLSHTDPVQLLIVSGDVGV